MKTKRRKIKQLEALLKVRKIDEELKMAELAKKVSARQAYAEQKKMIQNMKQQVYANISNAQSKTVDVHLMMKYQMHLREMHIKEIQSDQSMLEADYEVDFMRLELQKSNQNKVIVEKLIDKQKDALNTQLDKIEDKQLDELSTMFAQRNRSGEE